MAKVLTFLRMPDLRYHPGDIRIGDIIQDPTDPLNPLSRAPSADSKPEDASYVPLYTPRSHTDYNFRLAHSKDTSLRGSVKVRFLVFTTPGSVSSTHGKNGNVTYTANTVETLYLPPPGVPSNDELTRRVRESDRVRAALRSGPLGSRPVYMITAVKIVQGLRVETASSRTGTGFNVSTPEALGVALDLGVSCNRDRELAFTSANPVIFAYQLHKIREKKKGVGATLYRPAAAFLTGDEGRRGDDMEVEIGGVVDVDELLDYDEDIEVTVLEGE
ncbi:hypothetical protein VTJ04DRAFT_8194 [Mycothermus thermophilus]|uniref:uncharacterized protein n=1 Tax=Humicola insolens TaxID=85995 RepID=UPI003743823A